MKIPRLTENTRPLVPLAVLVVVLTLIFPRTPKFGYDYKKGSAWEHETLIAQFDFPILKTDEQLREERAKNKTQVIPYYKYREDVTDNKLKAASELEMGSWQSLRPKIVNSLEKIYSTGVVSDEGIKTEQKSDDFSQDVIYLQKDKRASKKPASEVYKESEARSRLLSDVSGSQQKGVVDSVLRAYRVYDLVEPNLEYDAKTTELVNISSQQQISTTDGFVSAGQLIVSEGEIVTSEIEQILDSYKVEYGNVLGYGGPKILFWIGNFLIALMISLLLYLVIYFLNRAIFKDIRRYLYILFIFLLSTVLALLVNKTPRFLYMVPFTLIALYLEAFFKNKIILPFCFVSLIPLLIFADNGDVLFVMFMVASVVATFAFKFFNRGWQQFITAAITFLALVITYFGFRFIGMVNDDPYTAVLLLLLGSVLTVAGYTLIYLFEKMFNLVSNSRLRDLCDTNNTLLRLLENKAPGTFQHSLQVMNMVDAAARAIDANSLLARAGALYHDIGKMQNPLCFIENEGLAHGGAHFHDSLSPEESATAIIRHVPDGMELAERYGLPEVVSEFILTHHGTSTTGYFYNKYLNAGGDPQRKSVFSYSGHKPVTKEHVLLMICDSVEAASRTLKDNSPETFSKFIDGIIASKMNDGQFDEADISIRELNMVKETLKEYLHQVYHERIVYPKLKRNKKK